MPPAPGCGSCKGEGRGGKGSLRGAAPGWAGGVATRNEGGRVSLRGEVARGKGRDWRGRDR